MLCPYCGAETSSYPCASCGAIVSVAHECPSCGVEFDEEMEVVYCPFCGAALQEAALNDLDGRRHCR